MNALQSFRAKCAKLRRGSTPLARVWQRAGYGTLGVAVFLGLWFAVGSTISAQPAMERFRDFVPLAAGRALLRLLGEGSFWYSVAASLRRVTFGILLATLIGLPLGILIGFFRPLKLITNTPIQFIRMISPLAWMPIALFIFREFESAIYFLITMATVWPVVINTALGVARVNPQWLRMARNQGATDFQLIRHVVLPAIVPYILTSLRLALGVAWIVLVPVEFLGVSSGLGYLINDARDTLEYDRLMAVVLSIGIIGFLLDSLIQFFQNMFRWSWTN